MTTLWGDGLFSKRYWSGRLELRRNSLVYEIQLVFKHCHLRLVFWRKKIH